jgi:hypothetical protein
MIRVLNKFGPAALLMAMAGVPAVMQAQGVTMFGSLSNFDVLNDTGQDAHGFEIELDGVNSQQVYVTFNATRYGAPAIVPFNGGVYVRYKSSYDPAAQQFSVTTQVPAVFAPTTGHSCVMTNIPGCDHYGVVLTGAPTAVIYRWLVADPQNLGVLMPYAGPHVSIPQPAISIVPPVQLGGQPAVAFQIELPPPPPPEVPKPEAQFGDAQWVKVYKNEIQREVALDELVGGDPVVPDDPGLVETEWKLLQFNPHSANSGTLRSQASLSTGSHAVVRRYEHYKYAGSYDPLTHKAVCGGDGTCTAPLGNELGDYIGSQMAAANVGVPSVTVTRNGSGTVTGANGQINCGGSCTANTAIGASITLTASPASNSAFTGWSGACAGTESTCSLTVNDAMSVTASFTPVFTLSVGRSGSGTVTGDPAGALATQISCGKSCSAKFTQGTAVTLTATPAAGLNFVSWSGACSGTAPVCTVVINQNTQVQANFK